ncbi:MAG: glycosyltransferase 87 family protein, partial [Gaiellaceae bacterium]
MNARTSWLLAAGGVAGFVVACLFVEHGLRSSGLYADVNVYSRYAGEMTAGRVPYRDFFDEYPPLAQPVFLLARAGGASHYALVFKSLMAACGAGAVGLAVVIMRALGASLARTAAAVAAIAVAPVVTGPIFLNAYDLWPAFLLSLGLAALVTGRPRIALGVLGAAAAAKVYPVAVLPVAALYIDRNHGRQAAKAALGWFAAVVVLANVPFAVVGPGGLRYSYWIQAKRGLELNSLGSSLLLAAQKLGLYDATIANRPPGSDNLIGALPDAVALLSGLLVLAAIVAVSLLFARGRRDDRSLVLAAA